jgi:hypothetical protein
MSHAKPTKTESDKLVEMKKVVSKNLVWKRRGPYSWHIQAVAAASVKDSQSRKDRQESFRIVGYVGKTNYSFALIYRGCPLRKYTAHSNSPHRIGNELFCRPHKHKWNGYTENKEAYYPDDINPDDNINEQFLSFCKECNISLAGAYQTVAFELK